jgi:hypothetical protein
LFPRQDDQVFGVPAFGQDRSHGPDQFLGAGQEPVRILLDRLVDVAA